MKRLPGRDRRSREGARNSVAPEAPPHPRRQEPATGDPSVCSKRCVPDVSGEAVLPPYWQDQPTRGAPTGSVPRARGAKWQLEVLLGPQVRRPEMLEPQSPALFALLIAIFGVLMWRMLATRRAAFRVLAACLAFVPAMAFGVLAVNKYYGYYQTWGAMTADLTQQGASAASGLPDVKLAADSRSGTLDGSRSGLETAQRQGYLMRLTVTGQRSHLTRAVYVYLPPQYFQPAYRGYRFPAIELIHGQPGCAAGLGHRGRGDACLRPPSGGQARPARRPGHAGRERRRQDLAAVPEPGGRPAGPDLPRGGPAGADRAPAAGVPAGSRLGGGRLLRGRVLRGQHGPALPAPLRVRGRAQRLLRAAGQPADRVGPSGQPVRRR